MRISIFGLGYVGAVSLACLAREGHHVTGVDVDAAKLRMISEGKTPVVEEGMVELMAKVAASGLVQVTTDAAKALRDTELSLICVGTPSGSHGETDLSYISRALADLREAMTVVSPPASGFHSVVIRSTVPPGTGEMVVAPVFAPSELPTGWSVGTAMCPEFLREGCGVEDFFAPPFV